jgi:hypothetical protein
MEAELTQAAMKRMVIFAVAAPLFAAYSRRAGLARLDLALDELSRY